MSSYEGLAASYDALTTDVGYEKRADFLEKLFRRSRIPVHTVLDLACGTGTGSVVNTFLSRIKRRRRIRKSFFIHYSTNE